MIKRETEKDRKTERIKTKRDKGKERKIRGSEIHNKATMKAWKGPEVFLCVLVSYSESSY
jgi:hypothetical protein